MGYNCHWLYGSIFIAVVASHAKFRENSNFNLYQFKVIQGHWSWCQSKAHMQFPISHSLIVTLDYLALFSRYWRIKLENNLFPPLPCLTPRLGSPQTRYNNGWILSCKNCMKIAYSYFDVIHVFLNGLLLGGCVVTWYKWFFHWEYGRSTLLYHTRAHIYMTLRANVAI